MAIVALAAGGCSGGGGGGGGSRQAGSEGALDGSFRGDLAFTRGGVEETVEGSFQLSTNSPLQGTLLLAPAGIIAALDGDVDGRRANFKARFSPPHEGEMEGQLVAIDGDAVDVDAEGADAQGPFRVRGRLRRDPLDIRIAKIWSDQFPGYRDNALPGAAGAVGNQRNVILMGARAAPDLRGWVGAEIEVRTGDASSVLVRLARVDETSPVGVVPAGAGAFDGSLASLTVDLRPGSTPDDYYVAAGPDLDADGELTPGEVQVLSRGYCKIVTQFQFNEQLLFLWAGLAACETLGPLSPCSYPTAGELARAFVDGSTPRLEGLTEARAPLAPVEAEHVLSHRVGIDYTAGAAPAIDSYLFAAGSPLSMAVQESATLSVAVRDTIRAHACEVVTRFDDGAVQQADFSWPLQAASQAEAGLLRFDLDPDLFFSLGTARIEAPLQVSVVRAGGGVAVSLASLTGSLADLYDWNYFEDPALDRRMAVLQAGHGTLGEGGGVFRLEVGVNALFPELVGFDPVEALTAECSRPPGVTIVAPLDGSVHTVGESVVFEGIAVEHDGTPIAGRSLVWTSSLQGALARGEAFVRRNLRAGTHTITLEATSPAGLRASASVEIVMEEPPPPDPDPDPHPDPDPDPDPDPGPASDGIQLTCRPVNDEVVAITWRVSSRVLQRGAAFFELEYQVSSVDQWIPVFITEEPTSGRAPAFIDHGGGEYCFRMIATREGNFGDAILGTGYCGDCQ